MCSYVIMSCYDYWNKVEWFECKVQCTRYNQEAAPEDEAFCKTMRYTILQMIQKLKEEPWPDDPSDDSEILWFTAEQSSENTLLEGCVCVCVWERESVCVWERERERVCVCVCVRERERVCVFWPFVFVGHGSMAAGFVMNALHYHRTFSFFFIFYFLFW